MGVGVSADTDEYTDRAQCPGSGSPLYYGVLAAWFGGGGGRAVRVYDELGVTRVINASATLTRLGGSRMPPVVVAAMAEAAGSFIDLDQLQERVGNRIAELTGN